MLFEAIRKLFGGSKKCAGDSKMERGSSCACKGKEKNNASAGTVKLSDLEDFVSYVVKNRVDAPEEVKVETIVENNAKTIRISCRKDDTGKIIGKKVKRSLLCALWWLVLPEECRTGSVLRWRTELAF